MTVHVQELVSDVTVIDDFPLSEPQLEAIATFVIARFAEMQRDQQLSRHGTDLVESASSHLGLGRT